MLAVLQGLNGSNPSQISTSGTAVQYFPFLTNVFGAANLNASSKNGYLYVPDGTSGRNFATNGQIINVAAGGDVTIGSDVTSPTITLGLYISKNPLAASPTISALATVAYSTAGEFSNAGTPFSLTAVLQGTTASGLLRGTYSFQVDNQAANTGAITGVTGINFSSQVPFGLLIGVTFSVAASAPPNSANLYQFGMEA
jgi:hypothetical protein